MPSEQLKCPEHFMERADVFSTLPEVETSTNRGEETTVHTPEQPRQVRSPSSGPHTRQELHLRHSSLPFALRPTKSSAPCRCKKLHDVQSASTVYCSGGYWSTAEHFSQSHCPSLTSLVYQLCAVQCRCRLVVHIHQKLARCKIRGLLQVFHLDNLEPPRRGVGKIALRCHDGTK